MPRRKNLESALAVEKAIRAADNGKIKSAAIECVKNKIPLAVALRVITKPNKRRDYIEE